jgi:hypothetical protein
MCVTNSYNIKWKSQNQEPPYFVTFQPFITSFLGSHVSEYIPREFVAEQVRLSYTERNKIQCYILNLTFLDSKLVSKYTEKLRGFSLQANYTDRATGACQRS